MQLGRRDILEKSLALGAVTVVSAFSPSALLDAWARQEERARRATRIMYIAPLTLPSRSAKMLWSGETELRVNRGGNYRLPFD